MKSTNLCADISRRKGEVKVFALKFEGVWMKKKIAQLL